MQARFDGALDKLEALDKEKLRIWLNYANFLLVALPYPTGGGAHEFEQHEGHGGKVRPSDMETFWKRVLNVAWGGHLPQARHMLLAYMEEIHPTCIEHVTKVLGQMHQAVINAAQHKKRGGRKNMDEVQADPNWWCYHEDVLDLLLRFFKLLDERAAAMRKERGIEAADGPVATPMPAVLAHMLEQCAKLWLGHDSPGGSLSPSFRAYAMRLTKVHLLSCQGERPPPKLIMSWLDAWNPRPRRVYLEAAYTELPDFVRHRLLEHDEPEDESGARRRQRLEVALVDAFTAMLQCGSLSVGGEQMQRRALAFLHMMALRGPHLRAPVEAALKEFLKNNAGFVGEFLQLAVVECVVEELRLTVPAGELLSSMHLNALVRNWTADMPLWQQSLGIPPARMLMVSLLHQCSPDGASRRLALELAAALAKDSTVIIDAAEALGKADFVGLSSCVASALKYSHALALKYSEELAEPLLREAVGAARLLSDASNESMFQLILPWLTNIGSSLEGDEASSGLEQWAPTWRSVLEHLMQLSYQCHARSNSSFLFVTLEACWKALLVGKRCSALYSVSIDFLVDTHATGGAALLQKSGAELTKESAILVRHLCLRIIMFISSEATASLMTDLLLRELPCYAAKGMPDATGAPTPLHDWLMRQHTQQPAPSSPAARELSAFLLAAELLHAHPMLLQPQLPALLVLALVYFGPGADEAFYQGKELLGRALASLTELPEDERKSILSDGLAESADTNKDARVDSSEFWDYHVGAKMGARKRLSDTLCGSDGSGTLRRAWARTALSWAMESADERCAVETYAWYGLVQAPIGFEYTDMYVLTCCLATAAVSERQMVVTALLKLLLDYATQTPAILWCLPRSFRTPSTVPRGACCGCRCRRRCCCCLLAPR